MDRTVTLKQETSGHAKTERLTERQSQCDFDFITGDENQGDRIRQKDKEEKNRG
jgi:hypothetical protein